MYEQSTTRPDSIVIISFPFPLRRSRVSASWMGTGSSHDQRSCARVRVCLSVCAGSARPVTHAHLSRICRRDWWQLYSVTSSDSVMQPTRQLHRRIRTRQLEACYVHCVYAQIVEVTATPQCVEQVRAAVTRLPRLVRGQTARRRGRRPLSSTCCMKESRRYWPLTDHSGSRLVVHMSRSFDVLLNACESRTQSDQPQRIRVQNIILQVLNFELIDNGHSRSQGRF